MNRPVTPTGQRTSSEDVKKNEKPNNGIKTPYVGEPVKFNLNGDRPSTPTGQKTSSKSVK